MNTIYAIIMCFSAGSGEPWHCQPAQPNTYSTHSGLVITNKPLTYRSRSDCDTVLSYLPRPTASMFFKCASRTPEWQLLR
jgi:hypothetical protein